MEHKPTIYFGPPGTGKTTKLLSIVEEALAGGTPPDRIGYLSFSKKAATEAATRACAKFNMSFNDLPYFKTLHALAYNQLSLKKTEVMDDAHLEKFAEAVGLPFSSRRTEEDLFRDSATLGDKLLSLWNYKEAKMITSEEVLRQLAFVDVLPRDIDKFGADLCSYKKDNDLLDFGDMLTQWRGSVKFELLIIDEAQDLTPVQWKLAERLMENARRVIIAGDDDQAIYEWAGAEPAPLIEMDANRIVLPKSYRLPSSIKELCDQIIRRVAERQPKQWSSREAVGRVSYESSIYDLDMSEGNWLILARHHFLLTPIQQQLRNCGYIYKSGKNWSNETPAVTAIIDYEKFRKGAVLTEHSARRLSTFIINYKAPEQLPRNCKFEDMKFPFEGTPDWMTALNRISPYEREYYRSCLRNGERLTKPGRIEISTIHGAKGGEADNVILLPTVNSRVFSALEHRPDPEHRLFYVAASRAKNTLFLVNPTGDSYYNFPEHT